MPAGGNDLHACALGGEESHNVCLILPCAHGHVHKGDLSNMLIAGPMQDTPVEGESLQFLLAGVSDILDCIPTSIW